MEVGVEGAGAGEGEGVGIVQALLRGAFPPVDMRAVVRIRLPPTTWVTGGGAGGAGGETRRTAAAAGLTNGVL